MSTGPKLFVIGAHFVSGKLLTKWVLSCEAYSSGSRISSQLNVYITFNHGQKKKKSKGPYGFFHELAVLLHIKSLTRNASLSLIPPRVIRGLGSRSNAPNYGKDGSGRAEQSNNALIHTASLVVVVDVTNITTYARNAHQHPIGSDKLGTRRNTHFYFRPEAKA